MEKITGLIEDVNVSKGVTKKENRPDKPWTRYNFLINGSNYSTFDAKIGDSFFTGATVTMEGEQKGNFWNMKTMEKVLDPENAKEFAKYGIQMNTDKTDKPTSIAQDRELNITALSMVKSAAVISSVKDISVESSTKACVNAYKIALEELER